MLKIQYPPIDFWDLFKSTPGAMSTAEAIFMYNACLKVNGDYVAVEMGTFKGKSALVTMMAWKHKGQKVLNLLEPEFENLTFLQEAHRNIKQFQNRHCDNTTCVFLKNLSTDFLPLHNKYSYIMWDSGSHSHELVQAEKPLLEDKVEQGGIIVMHDINSQFTACTEAYHEFITSGKYEAVEFNWQEIFDYVQEHQLEEGNNSWHLYPELSHPPNFIGALKRK